MEEDFILGFQSTHDALKLASSLAERPGLEKFDKIEDDSIDLLNEFLSIVVGRTISEWDQMRWRIHFESPMFKKDYQSKGPRSVIGYIISLDITSDVVGLEEANPVDELLLRVDFAEKVDNKIENKKIMLAEDSNVMRTIIARGLKEHGAKVIEARNGEEAVKLHRMRNPDLALMDINMLKMSGLDAIAKIGEFHPNAKFMILSSSSRKDEIIAAKTLKVSGYLVKPIDTDQLIARISAVI